MGRRRTDNNAVDLEESSDIALNEAFVEVATDTLRKSTGIDEESLQGINDASPRGVGKAVSPCMTRGKIN